MQTIYVDNHLCIICKPEGVPTQPVRPQVQNAVDWAKAWIKRTYRKPGRVYLEPIHRLDQPVSGLVLLARTSKALSRLQEMMRNQQIKKEYYAWVERPLPEASGVLEHYLFHDDHRAQVVSSTDPRGKKAVLSYQTLKVHEGRALLEIRLETGRYHQIRAQLSAMGSPILGDRKYRSQQSWTGEGIALHHGKLHFFHPITKEEKIIISPSSYRLDLLPDSNG